MNKSDEEKKDLKELYKIQVSIVLITIAKETIKRFIKTFPNMYKDYIKDKSLYHALHSSAITLYAKPFTNNYGENGVGNWKLYWEGYAHNLMYKKGKPKKNTLARGYYLYRDGDPEKVYVLVVVHDGELPETLCLSEITKKTSQIKWPENSDKVIVLDKELLESITSNCECTHWGSYQDKISDVNLKCLHLRLIECRDKIYAHQDSKYITVKHIVPPKIEGIPDNEENTLVVDISHLLIPFISQEDIQLMPKLCDEIIKLLNEDKKQLMKKCSYILNGKLCEITSSGTIK